MKNSLLIASCAAALVASMSASAQPAAPAADPVSGPAVPGLCVFDRSRAFGTSLVGQAIIARMKQLSLAVDAELKAEKQGLENEKATLEKESNSQSVPRDQFEQKVASWQRRAQIFERKAQVRNQELELTQQHQFEKVAAQIDPIVRKIYTDRKCAILVERGQSVYFASPESEITDAAINQLNAVITTVAFDKENLQGAEPAPAAATAATPAKPAASKKR